MPPLSNRTTRLTLVSFFLSVFIVISGCGRDTTVHWLPDPPADEPKEIRLDEDPEKKDILASVEGEHITADIFRHELATLSPDYKSISEADKMQFLEALINKLLLLQEAKKKGLQDEEGVKRLIQKVEEEIIIQGLIDREIGDKAQVKDEEVREHYQKNRTAYAQPVQIRARHIVVDSKLLAIKILSDLDDGKSFEDLAKRYSLDIPTKDNGGDLGYFTMGTLIDDFEQACMELDIGEISEEVKTDLGYHIIEVLDKKEARIRPLEEVEKAIRAELLMQKEITIYDKFLRELREDKEITINHRMIETLELGK